MNHKLNKYGYIIKKNEISQNQIEMIINDLTIIPTIDDRFKNKNEDDSSITYTIYMESLKDNKFILPRYYGIQKFGIPSNIKFNISEIDYININFSGILRDYQTEIINKILPEYCNPDMSLKKYGGSIISIPPGKGKTVLAIKLITLLKVKSLIIVHKTFLLNQWKERINQYSNASIGIIQQNNIDINNKDIVIEMLQSVAMKNYDKELFDSFQFIIYDECHHLGAKIFCKSLMTVRAPYYLGLSATPERKDNLDKVFKFFLGDIKYRGDILKNTEVSSHIYYFQIDENKLFKTLQNKFRKTIKLPEMITNLCNIPERNDLIIDIINNILKKEPTRKILLLSGRCNESSVNHLKIIYDKLSHYECGYYKGGMKQHQLELSSTKQIIIGTYNMAQEGLDIPLLDTLILATPLIGDIAQTCGRILRGENINKPLIVDISDKLIPFSAQSKKRCKYYIENGYKCTYYNNNIECINENININNESNNESNNDDLFIF